MDGIEYIFGTGDGHVETWVTSADVDLNGDGILDAVAVDFDGEGLFDDALWDSDGDGVADTVVVDFVSGDAGWYSDPGGDGTWSGYRSVGIEPPADPAPSEPDHAPPAGAPVVVAEPEPTLLVDTDGDGVVDTGLTDSDGDGLLDTASAATGDWWAWGGPPR